MFTVITLVSLLAVIAIIIILYRQYYRLVKLGENFGGPPAIPFFGNGLSFIGRKPDEYLLITLDFIERYSLKNCLRIWIGTELNIIMFDLKDIEYILGKTIHNDKAQEYKVLEPWMKEGLLISKGRKWFQRRKIITPAFHFKILEQFISVFDRHATIMIQILKNLEKNIEFDFYKIINLATLDVICEYQRILKLSKKYSGPPCLPIVGNAHLLINKTPEEFFLSIMDFYNKYQVEGIFKLIAGPELLIFFGNLKNIEELLSKSKHIEKSIQYNYLRPWMKDGLLLSNGKKWFQRRRILTPAFHFQVLEQFVKIFHKQSNILIKQMKIKVQDHNTLIDLYKFINLAALDVICESAMGVSVNAQTNADSQYVKAVKTISMVLHKRMFDMLYRFDFIFKFTRLAYAQRKALKILHSFSENVIIARREELIKATELKKSYKDDCHENILGSKKKMAFLDILLQSEIDGKPLSNLDIREEVDTFMFEGHDTTSSAILFFFYNIATNPDAQLKCFNEIREILGDNKNKPITFDDLNNLNYIELCIKETLRLFPSVPLLGRKINQECEINGKLIPAGTNIGISPLQLGRIESIFPNANKFIPERFDVVTSAEKMNPYAYIPFSAGPRNCIGQKFAMLEIKSVVSNILRNFEVEYCGDNEPILIAELILKSRDPLMFKIKERIY